MKRTLITGAASAGRSLRVLVTAAMLFAVLTVTNADNWSGSAVHAGVVGGAGLQYAITNNVSFGVEYLHTQYGSADSLTSGTTTFTQCFGAACTSASAHLHATSTNTLDTDTVRAVLNFKLSQSYDPLK